MRCVSAVVKRRNLSGPRVSSYLLRLLYRIVSILPSWHEISGQTADHLRPDPTNTLPDPHDF